MAKEIRNVSASVRARLLQLAKASGQSFDLVLTRFALERLLFRLSQSPHANRFVLKGAMLMMSWFDDPHRGTRDLDLLGFGDPSPDPMLETFREILAQEADDGVTFDPDTLHVDRIREALDYGGLRLRVIATISGARINLTIDIGFGDALEPGVEILDYPNWRQRLRPKPRRSGLSSASVHHGNHSLNICRASVSLSRPRRAALVAVRASCRSWAKTSPRPWRSSRVSGR